MNLLDGTYVMEQSLARGKSLTNITERNIPHLLYRDILLFFSEYFYVGYTNKLYRVIGLDLFHYLVGSRILIELI
jgi:hypothetical protein